MVFGRVRRRLIVPESVEDPRLKTSWFQPANETMAEIEKLLANSYFLVRQGDEFGERLKCPRCGLRESYITFMCVPKPITGLFGGLYAYYRAFSDARRETDASPAQLTRFQQIKQILNSMPDLSHVHPLLARKVVKDIGSGDMLLGAVSLGILEPISRTEANRLVERINERGANPRYRLDPVKGYEVARALEYSGPKFTRSRW